MDVLECIKNRRSIRNFLAKDVENSKINILIDAARHAPSAGNVQDWFFVIVRNNNIKKRIAEAAYNQNFIGTAPVIIIYFADKIRISRSYGERGKNLYSLQDSGAAIQNILLAAYNLGLGTCWIGAFNEKEVEAIMQAPEGYRAVGIIPVGYPAEKPKSNRRDISEIISYEQFKKE